MNSADQVRADAANDAYINRPSSDPAPHHLATATLNGHEYKVFGYADDPITGSHATAYQDPKTLDIIVAYRGTDPDWFSSKTHAEKVDHALTIMQDIAVDATMVRDTVNPQKSAADAFTAQMIAKARLCAPDVRRTNQTRFRFAA